MFETKRVPEAYDELAPDGSEVRGLLGYNDRWMSHCTLPAGHTSRAVMHTTIGELWYFLEGAGQLWRKQGDTEHVVDVGPGSCVTLPPHTHFQFRSTGHEPLRFLVAQTSPWSGAGEALRVEDKWPPQLVEHAAARNQKGRS